MTTREITDADGAWLETVNDAGRVVGRQLRAPTAEFLARSAPARAVLQEERAANARRAAALLVVRAQVARVKAIAPADRTPQDRWLLALSLLAAAEE